MNNQALWHRSCTALTTPRTQRIHYRKKKKIFPIMYQASEGSMMVDWTPTEAEGFVGTQQQVGTPPTTLHCPTPAFPRTAHVAEHWSSVQTVTGPQYPPSASCWKPPALLAAADEARRAISSSGTTMRKTRDLLEHAASGGAIRRS
jgi:hypothetical protein